MNIFGVENFQIEDISGIDLPPYSPNMSPTKHACDILVRRLAEH